MLKRSTKTITLNMTDEFRKTLDSVFLIVDGSLGTQYYKIFFQVYVNSNEMSLEQVAKRCFISRNTLVYDLERVNKIIQNTIYFYQNQQIFT